MSLETAYTLEDLARHLGAGLEGAGHLRVRAVAAPEEAGPGTVTVLLHPQAYPKEGIRASAVVMPREWSGPVPTCARLRVDHPRRALARLLGLFHTPHRPPVGVHPTAVVGSVRMGQEVAVGALCVVEDGAVLGDGVVLFPGVYVGPGVEIGPETWVYPQVVIREGCRIGARVIIHPGAVIGADGFGFVEEGGRWVKIPQMGGVVIEDEVEIGAGVTIDRATLGVTRVGRGTKIDDQVHIGHNVVVGAHGILVAQVGIAGSAHLGDRVILGGQAGVADHRRVGDRVQAAARTGITRDIAPGEVVSGFPAIPHREWLRLQAVLARLPTLYREVQALQRRLARMEAALGGAQEEEPHAGHSGD